MTSVLFIGEKPLGEWAFAHLLEHCDKELEIVGAVSNADGGAGWWNSYLVMDLAKAKGVPFFDSVTIGAKALTRLIRDLCPDVLVVVQGRTIISDEALSVVEGRAFNLHLAPLPRYRGFYSANHALLEDAAEFGVTVHWIEPTVDTGAIAFEERIAIAPDETAESLYAKSTKAGMNAFRSLVDAIVSMKEIPSHPQAGDGRYFPRNSLEAFREIRDTSDGREVDRKARAFYFPGFPSAYFEVEGRRFSVMPVNPPRPCLTREDLSNAALRMLQG